MSQEDGGKKGGLRLAASNRKPAADASLFNQVMPRGDYVAEVVASDVIWKKNKTADLLLLVTCRNKWGFYKTTLMFRIHDPDQAKQAREREKVIDLGVAMRVYAFDDSDQLHNRPFMLTVWNDWKDRPMRFTCRPSRRMASGGKR